mmetsp:Transcript_57149/g.99627  ORF Transcript_57149/g.99627 Transcript_57149/m.99627 type:complete len:295 (+) Transcript_57149:13-897(+)
MNQDFWFVVRAPRHNIDIAEQYDRWATTPGGEAKLQRHVAQAWTSGRVMLLFAPNNSAVFCAAAEVLGLPGDLRLNMRLNRQEPPWVAEGVTLASAFDVQWEVKPSAGCNVSFQEVHRFMEGMSSLKDMQLLTKEMGEKILTSLKDGAKRPASEDSSSQEAPAASAKSVARPKTQLRRGRRRAAEAAMRAVSPGAKSGSEASMPPAVECNAERRGGRRRRRDARRQSPRGPRRSRSRSLRGRRAGGPRRGPRRSRSGPRLREGRRARRHGFRGGRSRSARDDLPATRAKARARS